MRDSFNREIMYLRISVTDKCNLRCTYCMPPEGVPVLDHADLLSFEEITAIVRAATGLGFRKFRLTGGEPLVRRGITELVRMLKGIREVETLGMTTNGILLPRYAAGLKEAGLDSLNISLDTLDPALYAKITRCGKLEDALEGVQAAKKAGFDRIKINMVVGKETAGGELEAMGEFCRANGLLLQRIRQYSLLESKSDEMQYERPPACGACNRIRLTADGYLKSCLHSDEELKVDMDDIEGSLMAAVRSKPVNGFSHTTRPMNKIGG